MNFSFLLTPLNRNAGMSFGEINKRYAPLRLEDRIFKYVGGLGPGYSRRRAVYLKYNIYRKRMSKY